MYSATGVPVDQVIRDDARHLVRGDLTVGDLFLAGRQNLHDGLELAHADATGLGDRYILEMPLGHLVHKRV